MVFLAIKCYPFAKLVLCLLDDGVVVSDGLDAFLAQMDVDLLRRLLELLSRLLLILLLSLQLLLLPQAPLLQFCSESPLWLVQAFDLLKSFLKLSLLKC